MRTFSLVAVLVVTIMLMGSVKCSYSPPYALEMAYMSAIAYENILNIDAWNCKICSTYKINQPKAFINLTSGVVGFTGYSTSLSAIVVSFRGASNINTFIQDLKTAKVDYDKCADCQVSKSFSELYETVKPTVLKSIESLKRLYRNARIFVTGHGLGGSFAQLAALDISELYQTTDAVYVFGSCRVGNPQFATFYSKKIGETYRVIHYADVVPHLPVYSASYTHAGPEVWYESDMQSFRQCEAEDPKCSSSIPANSLSVQDNNINHYMNLSPTLNNIQREQ
jgi:hypothetical protein